MNLLTLQWFLSADGGPCSMPTRFGRLVEYFLNMVLCGPPPTSTEAVSEGHSFPADGIKSTFTEFPLNGPLLERINLAARLWCVQKGPLCLSNLLNTHHLVLLYSMFCEDS